jgi:uncharacterized membrane protein YfcA
MMVALTLQTLGVVWLGAFLGAVAAGGAGFAFALTASAVWLHALEPVHTTMLVVACGTLLHVTLVWPVRRSIEPARLLPFAIGGLIGIPIGVALLTHVDTRGLKGALGLFLVVYGTYALLAPRLPEIRAAAARPMPRSASSGAFSAGSAATRACCRASGRNCGAGARTSPAACTSPSSSWRTW